MYIFSKKPIIHQRRASKLYHSLRIRNFRSFSEGYSPPIIVESQPSMDIDRQEQIKQQQQRQRRLDGIQKRSKLTLEDRKFHGQLEKFYFELLVTIDETLRPIILDKLTYLKKIIQDCDDELKQLWEIQKTLWIPNRR